MSKSVMGESMEDVTYLKCGGCGATMTQFKRIVAEHLGIKQFGAETLLCTNEKCSRRIDEKQIQHLWQNMSTVQVENIDPRKYTDEKITNTMVERYGLHPKDRIQYPPKSDVNS